MPRVHIIRRDNDGQGWIRLLPGWATDPPNHFSISLGEKVDATELTEEQIVGVRKQLLEQSPGAVITIE